MKGRAKHCNSCIPNSRKRSIRSVMLEGEEFTIGCRGIKAQNTGAEKWWERRMIPSVELCHGVDDSSYRRFQSFSIAKMISSRTTNTYTLESCRIVQENSELLTRHTLQWRGSWCASIMKRESLAENSKNLEMDSFCCNLPDIVLRDLPSERLMDGIIFPRILTLHACKSSNIGCQRLVHSNMSVKVDPMFIAEFCISAYMKHLPSEPDWSFFNTTYHLRRVLPPASTMPFLRIPQALIFSTATQVFPSAESHLDSNLLWLPPMQPAPTSLILPSSRQLMNLAPPREIDDLSSSSSHIRDNLTRITTELTFSLQGLRSLRSVPLEIPLPFLPVRLEGAIIEPSWSELIPSRVILSEVMPAVNVLRRLESEIPTQVLPSPIKSLARNSLRTLLTEDEYGGQIYLIERSKTEIIKDLVAISRVVLLPSLSLHEALLERVRKLITADDFAISSSYFMIGHHLASQLAACQEIYDFINWRGKVQSFEAETGIGICNLRAECTMKSDVRQAAILLRQEQMAKLMEPRTESDCWIWLIIDLDGLVRASSVRGTPRMLSTPITAVLEVLDPTAIIAVDEALLGCELKTYFKERRSICFLRDLERSASGSDRSLIFLYCRSSSSSPCLEHAYKLKLIKILSLEQKSEQPSHEIGYGPNSCLLVHKSHFCLSGTPMAIPLDNECMVDFLLDQETCGIVLGKNNDPTVLGKLLPLYKRIIVIYEDAKTILFSRKLLSHWLENSNIEWFSGISSFHQQYRADRTLSVSAYQHQTWTKFLSSSSSSKKCHINLLEWMRITEVFQIASMTSNGFYRCLPAKYLPLAGLIQRSLRSEDFASKTVACESVSKVNLEQISSKKSKTSRWGCHPNWMRRRSEIQCEGLKSLSSIWPSTSPKLSPKSEQAPSIMTFSMESNFCSASEDRFPIGDTDIWPKHTHANLCSQDSFVSSEAFSDFGVQLSVCPADISDAFSLDPFLSPSTADALHCDSTYDSSALLHQNNFVHESLAAPSKVPSPVEQPEPQSHWLRSLIPSYVRCRPGPCGQSVLTFVPIDRR